MLQAFRAFAFAGLFAAACTTAPSEPPPPRSFAYEDIGRFNAAVASIRAGAEPKAAFQNYIDAASPGMKTYISVYPFTADELAVMYAKRPKYYASLTGLAARMKPFEPEIARAYGELEAMHPGAQLGSLNYVVAAFSAGGGAREMGTLMAVEFFGRTPQTDMSEFAGATVYDVNEMVQVAVHEGVHNLQRQIQGQENYISIYTNRERMTLRNFAVREGVADYVTFYLTGRRFEPRHAFAESREEAIWKEFQPIMNQLIFDQPGWMQGKFADGRQWPIQVGYFVGFKMAEHIVTTAKDKQAALIEVMSPHTDAQFQAIADKYAAKFGR